MTKKDFLIVALIMMIFLLMILTFMLVNNIL